MSTEQKANSSVKEEKIPIDEEFVRRILLAYSEKEQKFDNSLAGKGGRNVAISEGEVFYFPNGPNPVAYMKAAAVLIGRRTATESGMYVFRWGYTFKDWKSTFVSRKKVVKALQGTPFANLATIKCAAMPHETFDMVSMALAERLQFEYIEETRLGPNPDERYVVGLKNLDWTCREVLPQQFARLITVMERRLTDPSEIAEAVATPANGENSNFGAEVSGSAELVQIQ